MSFPLILNKRPFCPEMTYQMRIFVRGLAYIHTKELAERLINGGKYMRSVTITKKGARRLAAGAVIAAATAAVAVIAVLTSVGTQAENRLLPIYCVDRGDNRISLTFDVAWENSNTDELIEILDEYDARATFFITGDWCDRYPDDVKAFYDAGHEIQNHSDKHPHVEGINVNDLIADTNEASRKITMITGEKPSLYRAPYGEYDDAALTTLDGMGYKVIQWDVDSIDWDKPSPEKIKERVLGKVKSGSIVLFHNDLENTTEALPQILTELKSQGYEFVPVSELIFPDEYYIDADGTQKAVVQSSLPTEEELTEALALYSDELSAAGISEEQAAQAVSALSKGGEEALPAEIPEEAREVIASVIAAARGGAQDAQTQTAADSAQDGQEEISSAK